MSTPFKMKYQGSPLSMFSGAKSSPARSFWGKLKDLFSKGNAGGDDLAMEEGLNEDNGRISQTDDSANVPTHGPESHGGGGGGGGMGRGGGFMGLFGGGGGGNRGMSKWFQHGR